MRGLKYSEKNQCRGSAGSHRSRGAWIEITLYFDEAGHFKSHRSRGAWIEMPAVQQRRCNQMSHRSRGAWIEMYI